MNIRESLISLRGAILSNKLNSAYSTLILLNHFSFGININILGATLVDLRFIYHVEEKTASYLPVAVSIGYLLGALAGWSYRWLNRQVMLSIFIMLISVTIFMVPRYGQLAAIIVALVFNGIGCGAWDASSGFWIVEMWPLGNAAMLQLIQFMYGCGAVAAPLVVAPFVHGLGKGKNITAEQRIESLTVPFAVVGSALFIVPTIMLIMFFTCRYEKSNETESNEELANADVKENRSTDVALDPRHTIPHRRIKLAMCALCLATYNTAEIGYLTFAPSLYQYLNDGIDGTGAAHIQSVLSGFYTGGRLITAIITLKLIPDYILSGHYVGIFAGIVTLIVGFNSMTIVYLGSAVLGYGYSAMWPSILAFTERHLKLSDRVCSLFSFLTGLMTMTIPFVLAQVSLKDHPWLLFALVICFVSTSLTMFVGVRFWIWIDSRREGVR